MCLKVKTGCKIEIAKESIVCKKVIKDCTDSRWHSWGWEDQSFHKFNEKLESKVNLFINSSNYIYGGFNAFLENSGMIDTIINNKKHGYHKDLDIVYAIIPKGSEFCLGVSNEIVANKIIVFRSEKELNQYFNFELALEPILLKKLVTKSSENTWRSYFSDSIYNFKEIVEIKEDLKVVNIHGHKTVQNGFHVCIDENNTLQRALTNFREVVYAIIPRGTKYFKDGEGHYISSKIIVFRTEEEARNWIKTKEKEEEKVTSEQRIVWIAAEKESESYAKDWATGELIQYSKLQEKPDFKLENVLCRADGINLDITKKPSSYFHIFRNNKASIKLLPALIPQGAKYCLGNNNDVFTDKLIVFKNELSLKRYLGISQLSNFSSEIRITEKPISVFKIVRKVDDTEWEGIYQRMVYKFNDTLEACEHLSLDNKSGFHAYTNQELAKEEMTDMFKRVFGVEVVECIIPEGAEYRLGENKEIVSNKIIVKSCACS